MSGVTSLAAVSEALGFRHRFVPAKTPGNAATVVLLHGTGGDENDLISFGDAIAPGAALLSPRGKVLENGSPRFFRRLGEGLFDPDEVRTRAFELARFVGDAVNAYALDESRIFALGYSNGANIASTIMLLTPSLFRGAILFRPMVVYEPESESDLTGHSVFISAGRLDAVVPSSDPDRLLRIFAAHKADVTLRWQVAGHDLAPADIGDAARWYEMQSAH